MLEEVNRGGKTSPSWETERAVAAKKTTVRKQGSPQHALPRRSRPSASSQPCELGIG